MRVPGAKLFFHNYIHYYYLPRFVPEHPKGKLMEALARLGLFGFGYITIFILSNLVADTNEREANAATILENFHGVSFLLVTMVLGGWIYFTHFKDKEVPRNLKEILYIFTFVCGFTSIAGFLG